MSSSRYQKAFKSLSVWAQKNNGLGLEYKKRTTWKRQNNDLLTTLQPPCNGRRPFGLIADWIVFFDFRTSDFAHPDILGKPDLRHYDALLRNTFDVTQEPVLILSAQITRWY